MGDLEVCGMTFYSVLDAYECRVGSSLFELRQDGAITWAASCDDHIVWVRGDSPETALRALGKEMTALASKLTTLAENIT